MGPHPDPATGCWLLPAGWCISVHHWTIMVPQRVLKSVAWLCKAISFPTQRVQRVWILLWLKPLLYLKALFSPSSSTSYCRIASCLFNSLVFIHHQRRSIKVSPRMIYPLQIPLEWALHSSDCSSQAPTCCGLSWQLCRPSDLPAKNSSLEITQVPPWQRQASSLGWSLQALIAGRPAAWCVTIPGCFG